MTDSGTFTEVSSIQLRNAFFRDLRQAVSAVRERDRREQIAADKRTFPDRAERFRQRNRPQLSASVEGRCTDLGHALRHGDRQQLRTVIKRIVAEPFHTVRDRDRSELTAFKCAARDIADAVRNDRLAAEFKAKDVGLDQNVLLRDIKIIHIIRVLLQPFGKGKNILSDLFDACGQ